MIDRSFCLLQKAFYATFLHEVLKMQISLPQFTSPGRGFVKAVAKKRAVVWKPVKEKQNKKDKKTTPEGIGYSKGPGSGAIAYGTYQIRARGCMRMYHNSDRNITSQQS